ERDVALFHTRHGRMGIRGPRTVCTAGPGGSGARHLRRGEQRPRLVASLVAGPPCLTPRTALQARVCRATTVLIEESRSCGSGLDALRSHGAFVTARAGGSMAACLAGRFSGWDAADLGRGCLWSATREHHGPRSSYGRIAAASAARGRHELPALLPAARALLLGLPGRPIRPAGPARVRTVPGLGCCRPCAQPHPGGQGCPVAWPPTRVRRG